MSRIDEKAAKLREALGLEDIINEVGTKVLTEGVTLATLVREGSTVTEQADGWGDGCDRACFFTAGYLAAKARGLVD